MFGPQSLNDGASEIMTIVLYNLSHGSTDNNQLWTHTFTQRGWKLSAGIGKRYQLER